MKKHRVLVTVLAETRAHGLTFERFRACVLQPLQADLALCVGNHSREERDNPFYRQAKYVLTMAEPADFGDYLAEIIARDFPERRVDYRKIFGFQNQFLGGIRASGHPGSAGILLCYRHFLAKSIQQAGLLDRYDRFLITRSDYLYLYPHPPAELLAPDTIYVPEGERYGGITDRHAAVPGQFLLDFLDVWGSLFREFESTQRDFSGRTDWNLEKVLSWHLEKRGLLKKTRFFPYIFFTIRPPGGATQWSAGKFSPRYRGYVKYEEEFKRAVFFKKAFRLRRGWNREVFEKKYREPSEWTWKREFYGFWPRILKNINSSWKRPAAPDSLSGKGSGR